MSHLPFSCPKCKRLHHNGPISPDTPDIYECENCGRFRLRTDVKTEGVPPGQGEAIVAALSIDEIPEGIRLLSETASLGLFGKVLAETLKNYQALLAQKKASALMVQDKAAAMLKFLDDRAMLTMPAPAMASVDNDKRADGGVIVGREGEASGIGTSPSDPERLFTIDVTIRDLAELVEPMLLEANLAGRNSGRKAVLRAFGVTFDERSKFHAQAALVAKSPDHHVHQGAMAAFEMASKMVIHQAEEGAEGHKPKLDS